MVTIIITGHGNFATGIKSMLDLVIGQCDNLYFINFTEEMSSQNLQDRFQEVFTNHQGNVIFLCDIAGGTPFNQAAILMYENNKNYGVVGGINIPLILEILDQREILIDPQELLRQGKSEACMNIKIFGDETSSKNQEISNDGI
ncbi:MAG: PTS mannose transporter subunit IIAB [Spirochaetota bacterium]|nr:PTS mannose transporter subunit IIAB [Spirochaetota bacterium]